MCYNFDFLKKEKKYDDFTYACVEAEKSLVVSYSSTAVLARRALELAVKWVFSYDSELQAPYQDKLSSLIHDYRFKGIIDTKLFPMIIYIQKLGNKAVHSSAPISRDQAILSLRNLFEFVSWIDYCYSEEFQDVVFDESILADNQKERKTREELKDLYDRLSSKDRKLEEVMKENEEFRRINASKRIENKNKRDFKVDEISEFKTRKIYIDLEIELNGWTIGKDCIEELPVIGMPNKSGEGSVDYVLFGDNGKPLAVIEAKKTSVNPRIGQIQAQRYADCLEKKYNVRPIIFYTNGFEYYLWDDKSYPERLVSGIYTKEELEWMHFQRNNKLSLKKSVINEEITNRHYQKMAITAVCDSLEKGNRKALLVMATGSGKTRTAISLVDVLIRNKWVKNILFLADRTALVKQAKKNFKAQLPELSLCNLLDSQDNPESRMIFSTYPTMMNAIDDIKKNGSKKLFTSGHFDLIIIDESHRSIYKKYQDIFNYFDAMLVGLTATPKNDLDKNTYSIFELENNVPTYAYELGEAIEDGYLVPYHTIETKMKFMEQGIHYDDLTDEEKELFEETFEDDIRDISGEALNSFLFNNNTIDTVLQELMEKGLKVEGGDKLGKTIIFAKNKRHADFIIDRFNSLYPEHKGNFAKPVYTGINYVESTMDDFEIKGKLPQIAVSVDMLDTGIDIPEILNLVFFKKIKSKTKFWQMIGRGTRLCENLYGVGIDKDGFRIFDYCGNFEFFRTNKNGTEVKNTKSLTEIVFNIRIDIIKELQSIDYQTEDYIKHRKGLIKEILKEISLIDEERFNSRLRLKYIHKFNQESAFENLSDSDARELEEHVAPLIPVTEDDELAKRFDYLMYTIEYADLKGIPSIKPKNRVVSTAEKLSLKGSIQKVKNHEALIFKVQTNEHWDEADLFEHEKVREAFRELIKFIDSNSAAIYYTNFTDEIVESKEFEGEYTVNDMQSYRKKVNRYLIDHKDDIAIYKLRNNKPLTKDDMKHLEKILWEELGTKEDYKREFGEEPLLKLVSKVVGLEPQAANEVFSEFLSDESLNINQMEFIKLVVNYIIKNGSLDKRIINEHPFNKKGNVMQLFDGKLDTARGIIGAIDKINARLSV